MKTLLVLYKVYLYIFGSRIISLKDFEHTHIVGGILGGIINRSLIDDLIYIVFSNNKAGFSEKEKCCKLTTVPLYHCRYFESRTEMLFLELGGFVFTESWRQLIKFMSACRVAVGYRK